MIDNKFCFIACILWLSLYCGFAQGETFVLGAEDQAGPWGQADGTGCGNDIVKAAFAAVGDTVIFKVLPYVRAKKMALQGELSGCFAMSWMDDLKGTIIFASKPLYTVQYILVTRHSVTNINSSLDKLPLKSILGLVKDYEYPAKVRAMSQKGISIEEVASEEQNLKKLAVGRIDATIVDCDPLKSLCFLLKQSGVTGKIDSVSVVGVQGAFVGFSVRNPLGVLAKKHFDTGFEIILANQTCGSIIQSWITKYNQSLQGRKE